MTPPGRHRIEKLMALSPSEFASSMSRLSGRDIGSDRAIRIELDVGTVTVSFDPLPPVTLGKLLALPRARVTLFYDGVPAGERARFEKRFDLAFQRGGG